MRIGVIGIGRLGLCFATLCKSKGLDIIGCDSNEEYIKSLRDKTFNSPEASLLRLFYGDGNFHVTSNVEEVICSCDVIFTFVQTPSLDDGSYDHSNIENVVYAIISSPHNVHGKLFVIGSTVMPGFSKKVGEMLGDFGVSVAYNPEFIAQGQIINGLQFADFVLIGCENKADIEVLSKIYQTIMSVNPIIKAMSTTAAEITKIGLNCFLTMKISYANFIGEIAINSGIETEVATILSAIGSDTRIGKKFFNYGFGFSGVCLPRDNKALAHYAERIEVTPLIPKAIDEFNNIHFEFIELELISENKENLPFVFNQISYKKGVDIITDSQRFELCINLLNYGYRVIINESESVIDKIKPSLMAFGHLVSYNSDEKGFEITL